MIIAVVFITFKSTCALEFFSGVISLLLLKDESFITMVILSLYISQKFKTEIFQLHSISSKKASSSLLPGI